MTSISIVSVNQELLGQVRGDDMTVVRFLMAEHCLTTCVFSIPNVRHNDTVVASKAPRLRGLLDVLPLLPPVAMDRIEGAACAEYPHAPDIRAESG